MSPGSLTSCNADIRALHVVIVVVYISLQSMPVKSGDDAYITSYCVRLKADRWGFVSVWGSCVEAGVWWRLQGECLRTVDDPGGSVLLP